MFISFEGVDGSGKTSQIQYAAAALRAEGYDVLLTREPGGTPVGDEIRTVLFDSKNSQDIHPRTELLLFCASRAQLVAEVIRPHLAKGGIVISDRFADSTIVYQGYGRGLELDALRHIIDFATGGLWPDLTIFLDITPEEALDRRRKASLFGDEFNRLDDMALDFHRRVYQGYEALIAAEPQRWHRISATGTQEQVKEAVLKVLRHALSVKRATHE
ncbi:MAG: dTMP kinase [Chloroflexi bacterium]|nr:MAG: dTMP kinase [Chloroflexota bacterium]